MAAGEWPVVDGEPSASTANHRQDHRTAAEERVERAGRRVDRVARADRGDYDCGRSARSVARRREVLGAFPLLLRKRRERINTERRSNGESAVQLSVASEAATLWPLAIRARSSIRRLHWRRVSV